MKKLFILLSLTGVVFVIETTYKLINKTQSFKKSNKEKVENNPCTLEPFIGKKAYKKKEAEPVMAQEIRYADPVEVMALMSYLLEIDPATSNDVKNFIQNPEEMPVPIFSNFVSMSSNWIVREKLPALQTIDVKSTNQLAQKIKSDSIASAEFNENLKERESTYPEIKIKDGMIKTEIAVESAKKFCPVEYDVSQRPKIVLIRNFYLITLWQHRKTNLSTSFYAAHIQIDAYTGEVLSIQTR